MKDIPTINEQLLNSRSIIKIYYKIIIEEDFVRIDELENTDPEIQVFGLAKLKHGKDKVYQIMFLISEKGDDSDIIANYAYIRDGEKVANIDSVY